MSSIIVLDSSDEETDSVKKKQRLGPALKASQPPPTPVQTSMARVNPLKGVTTTIIKKSVAQPNDNFKIHLPTKRSTSNEPSADQVPEKRVKRLKPTTVVRSSDEEWLNRQKVSTQPSVKSPSGVPMLSKNLVNAVKGPVRVVKSPVTAGSPSRVIVITAPSSKSPSNYVRVAWNGKDPKPSSPPVVNKIITAGVKELPKSAVSPTVVNKSITTSSVKEQAKVVSVTPPIFNNNSVTIRRVLVNEERPKPIVKNSIITTACKPEQSKQQQPTTNMSATIRRVPLSVDPLKITMTPTVPNKNNNNSAVRLTNVAAAGQPSNASSTTSIKKIIMTNDPLKISPQPPTTVVKRNQNAAKPMRNGDGTSATTNASAPTILHINPAPIQRIVTVDLPKTPSSPPVITKNYSCAPKPQPKSSMSMSVITKNNSMPVKTPEQKMSPPVGSKPSVIMNRPSGLIVTPITCTGGTTTTETLPRSLLTTSRSVSKQQTKTTNRTRGSLAPSEHSMATITPSMMNMFPPGTAGFMGNQFLYDIDTSGRHAYMNPAYVPNRSMSSLENNNFPNITSPVFNTNYPSFSGGSITPVQGAGKVPNASCNTTRSSKSPATSTVTKSSTNVRSPAGFMGMPIDVDQPMPRMSPPVFNMNHPPMNGDPFSLMRNPNNIPSQARSTKSPKGDPLENNAASANAPSSPVFHRDLDNFVKNPFSYPQAPCITANSSNGPIYSLDSPARNNHHTGGSSPGLFKSPASTITSPAHSTISEGSSVSEFLNNIPPNGDEKSQKPTKEQDDKNKTSEEETTKNEENAETDKVVEEQEEEEEKEPLNPEFETLLKACREADSSEDMNRLIESKLLRYYYSVHPDFVKSRGFRKAVVAATENIKKNPDLVYYHLRPVVEEMKARIKSKAIVMTNDETSEAAATKTSTADEGIAEKVRNRQIRRLNKGLYILTRKIHKLENDEVDLDDENSSYLIVERYKKRACEIYDKICDLTGESKHALRQVKKPITFKDTDYPKFNKVVETFVNRTKEFPDFFDVLRMLEFCNERYNFGLLKEEMTTIAQDAFIKIGKLLQSRRKADLYETVSHFTSDCEDPAANDPALLAKLSENEKNQTSIGSIINKYAREQVRRKAESANATGDELNPTSGSCDSDTQSHEDVKSNNNNNNDTDKKKSTEESEETLKATTNGTHSPAPPSPHIISSASPSPSAGTSSAFRTSPPHAFASPQASPRTRWPSPTLPPPTATQSWSSNSLKILSVTSLNDSASSQILKPDNPTATSVDEIIISDEDL